MAKFIVVVVDDHHKKNTYSIETSSISIGRGFTNNIILTDPHISAEHVRIQQVADKWELIDCNSSNGVFFEKHKRVVNSTEISSGNSFYIGKTTISIYSPEHPVEPTKQFMEKSFMLNLLKKTGWLSSILLLLNLGLSYWFNESIDHMEKIPFLKLLTPIISLIIGVLFFAGVLAGIGLLVKKNHYFHKHTAIISSFFFLGIIASYVSSYIGFIFSSELVSLCLIILFMTLLFFLALSLHLILATNISKKFCYITTACLALMLALPITIISVEKYTDFHEIPVYNTYLFPPTVKIAFPKTPKQFLEDSAKLFND